MPLDISWVDKDELRQRVSLAGVAGAMGVTFDASGCAICPFHDDHSPSLAVFLDDRDIERWVCHPCGLSGDVYDLVRRLDGCSFPQAIDKVASLADAAPAAARAARAEWDATAAEALVDAAQARGGANVGWLCVAAGLLPEDAHEAERRSADTILRDLRWGVDHTGNVVMPHYDAANVLRGVKLRALDGYKWSFPGSTYTSLYGSHRPRKWRDVLLCEGEGDMAYVLLKDAPLDVYSLPSGADSWHDSWVDLAADRYFLAFDGDAAGVRATVRWLDALAGRECRVCPVPLGHDLKSSRPDVMHMLRNAVIPRQPPRTVAVQEDCFERIDGQNPRRLCTWHAIPTARLGPGPDGEAPGLEVQVHADGRTWPDALSVNDLHNAANLRRWAAARSLDCMASDADTQQIASRLLAQGSILPEVLQTSRAGAHRSPARYGVRARAVVAPDISLGVLPWHFTGAADVHRHVHLADDGPVDWGWVRDLLSLNEPAVMHPLIAWLAASARRDEVRHFPILFLGGSSGSGKTTTARLACRFFGSSLGIALSNATPFTLIRSLTHSTTLPVFIDEWSLQSREDARAALQSVIPAIYEAGVTPRGRADLSVVEYRLTAPVLAAGEDSFDLDREAERMVSLRLRRAHQEHDALANLIAAPVERFGRWFNEWLISADVLPPMPGEAGEDRPRHNRQVLESGWATLATFLSTMAERHEGVITLPEEPDLSALITAPDRENEYEVFLSEGRSMRDGEGTPVVFADAEGRGTMVRFRALTTARNLASIDVELPGRSRSMRAYFSDRYELEEVNVSLLGRSYSATLVKGLHL